MSNARALLLLKPGAEQDEPAIGAGIGLLQSHGIETLRQQARSSEQVRHLLRELGGSIDRIICGGGDGSVNLVVNGMLGSGLPLGVLPLGTANDFARTLGIGGVRDAFGVIAAGRTRRVDVGRANGRCFLNVAHLGLGAKVSGRLSGLAKRHLGPLSYALAAVDALREASHFHAEVLCDGHRLKFKAVQIAVGNGVFYGGGSRIAEDARIDDGRLDLYAIPAQPLSRLLLIAPALRRGRLARTRGVLALRARRVEIVTREPHVVTADGEHLTHTPVRFGVLPRALQVYVPPPEPGVTPTER